MAAARAAPSRSHTVGCSSACRSTQRTAGDTHTRVFGPVGLHRAPSSVTIEPNDSCCTPSSFCAVEHLPSDRRLQHCTPELTLAFWCRPAARASGMPHCRDQLLLPLRFRAVPRFAGINCCCPRALGQCRLGTRVSIVRANCRCPGRAELLVAMLRRLAMPVQATALPGGTARHRRDVERPAAVGRVAYSIELERGRVKASCDAYPCHRIEPRAMSCAWRCGCVLRCPCRPPHCSQFLGRRPRVPSY